MEATCAVDARTAGTVAGVHSAAEVHQWPVRAAAAGRRQRQRGNSGGCAAAAAAAGSGSRSGGSVTVAGAQRRRGAWVGACARAEAYAAWRGGARRWAAAAAGAGKRAQRGGARRWERALGLLLHPRAPRGEYSAGVREPDKCFARTTRLGPHPESLGVLLKLRWLVGEIAMSMNPGLSWPAGQRVLPAPLDHGAGVDRRGSVADHAVDAVRRRGAERLHRQRSRPDAAQPAFRRCSRATRSRWRSARTRRSPPRRCRPGSPGRWRRSGRRRTSPR